MIWHLTFQIAAGSPEALLLSACGIVRAIFTFRFTFYVVGGGVNQILLKNVFFRLLVFCIDIIFSVQRGYSKYLISLEIFSTEP